MNNQRRAIIYIAVMLSVADSPAFAQAPSTARDTAFSMSRDWRIVIVKDGRRFLHCAAIMTGPAGDLRLTRINARDWVIAVPANGRRGNVRASVGSEQMTLRANGQRAWWVISNAPFWGDPGQESNLQVQLGAGKRNSAPMAWTPRGAGDAIKEVERCLAQIAAPGAAPPAR